MDILFFRGFEPSLITHHHQLFGKIRAEHVESKTGADPMIVIDADKGVVVNIRRHAITFKIEKIHRLTAGREHAAGPPLRQQIDQVKVVTAFFHEGSRR